MNINKLQGSLNPNIIFWVILIVIPFVSWADLKGNLIDYFIYIIPEGQLLYVVSKLLGLYSIAFLWLHISYALLRKSVFNNFIVPWSIKQHHNTAAFAIVLMIVHIVLFFIAVSLRNQAIAVDLLLPSFTNGYYKSLLSFGVIAFWLILCVVITGIFLSFVNQYRSVNIWLHRLSLVSFILIYFHGLGVGSETKSGVLYWFYLFMGGSLIIFLLYRLGFLSTNIFNNKLRRT